MCAPLNSAIAEQVDRATWQSAFSNPPANDLLKHTADENERLFAPSTATGSRYGEEVCTMRSFCCCKHMHKTSGSTGCTFGLQCHVYS